MMKHTTLGTVALAVLLFFTASSRARSETAPDNYMNAGGMIQKWPNERMPLTFYIYPGNDVPGYEERFAEIAKSAFEEWSAATNGKVTFQQVDTPTRAFINLRWTNDPSKMVVNLEPSQMGLTKILSDKKGATQADIMILTKAPNASIIFNDIAVRFILLHEVGHALGLFHSTNAGDIMFAGGYTNMKEPPQISARDHSTICELYSDSVKATITGQDLDHYKTDDAGVRAFWDKDNEEGLAAMNKKDFLKAVGIFEKLTSEHPTTTVYKQNLISALNEAGNAAISKGSIDGGIGYIEKAMSLDTSYEPSKVNVARGYSMKADLLLNSGKTADAATYYKKALALLPQRRKDIIDHDVHYCALILEQLGKADEASKLRAKYPGSH
ncbi:MAG TPA: matrixin family metalloprotease [Oculatellaceae cyanobacterium]